MNDGKDKSDDRINATKKSRIASATNRRMERNKSFDEFRTNASDRITPLAKSLPQWHDYEDFYSAYVTPGGWDGGVNDDHVDVIFGSRPVKSINTPNGSRFYTERGAWLRYARTPAGQVNVFLYPPTISANEIQYDSFVVLDRLDSATDLTKAKLTQHIRLLSAWMAGGMLDQPIVLSQRPIYAFIRACKPYLEWQANSGQYVHHRPRMFTWISEVAKWSLTVGLSGALLLLLHSSSNARHLRIRFPRFSVSKSIAFVWKVHARVQVRQQCLKRDEGCTIRLNLCYRRSAYFGRMLSQQGVRRRDRRS